MGLIKHFPSVLTALLVVESLFSFSLGVSEAVYLAKYRDLKNECNDVWEWILAACVFNLVVSVGTCCGLVKLFENVRLAAIGSFIVAIWAAVTNYGISDSCYEYWDNEASILWKFVFIHFVILWISIGEIVFIVVGSLIYAHYEL